MSQLNSRIEDGQVTEAQLQKKIKELQVWWNCSHSLGVLNFHQM